MTRTTSARLAGVTYLLYIAVGAPSLALFNRATGGEGTAEKLASIARHVSDMRMAILLSLISCFSALVLGVALYGITRDEDHELATLALVCRVGEGVVGAASLPATLGLLWLATLGNGPAAPDAAAAYPLAGFLLHAGEWSTSISATLFAVGSTIFCWLFLRGRMVPGPLAWLGVIASVLLVVVLPLELAGLVHGPVTALVWIPMAIFEVTVALWLLIKGVPAAATGSSWAAASGSRPSSSR